MKPLSRPVLQIIGEEIKNPAARFVFPSETVSSAWARKACLETGVRSLAAERFLAWDRFKESFLSPGPEHKKPASALIRSLFARALARKNAAVPRLRSLIPEEFAGRGEIFAPSIAALLPSLALWEERRRNLHGAGVPDDEDRDLTLIRDEYGAFLESRGLFEPSWEKPLLRDRENRYVIFFPEVLEDFSEYREILDRPSIILADAAGGEAPPLRFFPSRQRELRELVLELRRLHEGGTAYADMAVSVPGFVSAAPYLFRELELWDIPFVRRAGKALGDYGTGRLFSLIGRCVFADFSFDALKPLVLNETIPWKRPELNRALVKFGVANYCVSPFSDRGRTVDTWEEAFKSSGGGELKNYYGALKQSLKSLASSPGFRELRDRYFAFRELLDMERCSALGNAVLARCIEELSLLIELEADYPELALSAGEGPPGALSFFVSRLNETSYVPAQEGGGVNIYDYPVAAGAPFAYHFVINATQSAAAVPYRPLGFLRRDKRAALGIEDRDMSADLFRLFTAPLGDHPAWISAAADTFEGAAIPHSYFARNLTYGAEEGENGGPYLEELSWWAGGDFPPVLFPVQKKGFGRWRKTLETENGRPSPRSVPPLERLSFPPFEEKLRETITRIRGDGGPDTGEPRLRVSPTDLTEFFSCPVFWFFRRVFLLEEYESDAALLDDESLGNIYHAVLEGLFTRIKNDGDGSFKERDLEKYGLWAEELTGTVLRSGGKFRGLLAYPLREPLAAAMVRRIRALLKTEARYFSGYTVEALEERLSIPGDKQRGLRLTGKIDRISSSHRGLMIIDYKTGAAPAQSHCREAPEGLRDFQIPLYIKLLEEEQGRRVEEAYFFSINKNELTLVVGNLEGKRACSREQYQPTLDALDRYVEVFYRALTVSDFSLKKPPLKTCLACSFKTICRSVYSLNAGEGAGTGAYEEEEEDDG